MVKRPAPGSLFDRFYNAWLDTGSLEGLEGLEGLEEYLRTQAESDGTTANRLLLAFFHTKQRDHVRAIEQFRAALAGDPGNAAAWYEKATIEARTLNFEMAIADLEKAAAGNPSANLAIEISKLLGKLHLRQGIGGVKTTARESSRRRRCARRRHRTPSAPSRKFGGRFRHFKILCLWSYFTHFDADF
ncbi:MAG: tetratricopeptide (TPR) repeat protein [Verrucomicrobiales bacterium]